MKSTDELRSLAIKVWPDAYLIDVCEGTCGHVALGGTAPKQFRASAIDSDGCFVGRASAWSSDVLYDELQDRLAG